MRRRLLLQAGTALLPLGAGQRAQAHNMAGAVRPPLPVPDIPVRLHNGQAMRLPALLTGRTSALQLMFTGCSAICPIQGALFAQVQAALPRDAAPLQLLSASIDPLADDPVALSAWLARHGGGASWRALSPAPAALDRWLDFLAGRVVGPDRHTAQVYFFDRQARLVLRTADFPPAQDTARLLTQLAAAA